MTWQGEQVFLTKLSQPYPPAVCAQYATLVQEKAWMVRKTKDEGKQEPRGLRKHCIGNPMLIGERCQWISTVEADSKEETASINTEETNLESVTETSVRSQCYKTEEDVPAHIFKPMAENGA